MTVKFEKTHNINVARILLSFVLAPPLGCMILFLMLNAFSLRIPYLFEVLSFSLIGCIVAYPAMLFFGLIVLILFDYNKIESLAIYMFAGGVSGALAMSFIAPVIEMEVLVFGGFPGILCASVSWFIMTYKRPV